MRRLFLFLLLVSLVIPSLSAAPRPIKEDDIYRFHWAADPEISPDGRSVAYVLVSVNEKHDGYETALWIVPATGDAPPRQLTAGPRDSSPRWCPDGSSIAFLRRAEKEPPQISILPLAGGESRQLTDVPEGTGAPVWSPDGKWIAFTASANSDDLARKKDKKAADDTKSDVRIVTQATFRDNDAGYGDPTHHDHIWIAPVSGTMPAEAKQVTDGQYDEGQVSWSNDGKKLYFASLHVLEPYYSNPDEDLYSVPVSGGEVSKVIDIDGPVTDATSSPDGSRIAFRGFINPKAPRSADETNLLVWDGSKATNLSASYDHDVIGDVLGDQHPPRGGGRQPIVWSADGKSVVTISTERGSSNLVRFFPAQEGKIDHLTSGNHDIYDYSATPDGSHWALAISDPTHIGDLYLFDASTSKMHQITDVNHELFAELTITAPEEIWYTSFDGRKIEGWIQKPPDFDAKKKYPMILEIHGGPHTAYGYTFTQEFLWMAAKGYVVLYTNPRGSTSYGEDFANIIQYHYPGDDYKDLMAGVDEVIRRGYVDAKKLGVTGGSGGGLLTNWTIEQTDRFAAAVSQRSVADWSAFWYTTDFTLFQPTWFRAAPFQDPKDFAARSPITFVEKIHTPLMLIEGESDLRAPPVQGGESMFRALKFLHKPVVMIRFPQETHELSRSGKPNHRVERLQHIMNWFDKYLMGKSVTLYDVH